MESDDATRKANGDSDETIGRRFPLIGRARLRGYSPAGTRLRAFFTVPRSVMILSCSRVIA